MEWLKRFCTVETGLWTDEVLSSNGWTAASDRRTLIVVPVASASGPLPHKSTLDAIVEYAAQQPFGDKVERLELSRTVGAAEWPSEKTVSISCGECHGDGKFRHECDCSRCTYRGFEECDDCDGKGTWEEKQLVNPKPRGALLLGNRIDLVRVAQVLEAAPACDVLQCGWQDWRFFIFGDGWRAVIMGFDLEKLAGEVAEVKVQVLA